MRKHALLATGYPSSTASDCQAPLAFHDTPLVPGEYHEGMATVDGAALPAGINQPSAAVGRVLTEAIKPDNPIKPNHPAGKQ